MPNITSITRPTIRTKTNRPTSSQLAAHAGHVSIRRRIWLLRRTATEVSRYPREASSCPASPGVQRFAGTLEPTPVQDIRESVCGLLTASREEGEQAEDRLPVLESDVAGFRAEAPMPAQRCSSVLLGRSASSS
jgi:hypothetical protein